MSVHDIELQILQLLALVIGSLVIFALQRVLSWLGVRLSADRLNTLENAVDKGMSLAVVRADDLIREKGWDHIDTKSVIIDAAMPIIETKFSDTLARAGIDLSRPEDRIRMTQMMERMWPDIASRLAASPVTPPSPTPAAVVVPAHPAA